MDILKSIKKKAAEKHKRLVLPESYDDRMLKAAEKIIDEELCSELLLIGNEKDIEQKALSLGVSLENIKIVNPEKFNELDKMAEILFEKRKNKDFTTIEEAKSFILNDKSFLFFGALLLEMDYADAMVAGAYNTTADVLRAALKVIGVKEGFKIASSCFIMITERSDLGENGIFVFGDCATVIAPDEFQLAEIAISTADTAKELLGFEPKVAMLSFSTKGSANHRFVTKVQKATELVRERRPDIDIDGELQLDAAIIPEVAKKKAPDSKVAGNANVLIFPDLEAGNIGYKLVERLGNAIAIGPILQGFKKPVNDLSRGCSVEDIVNVSAITLLKA